MRVRSKDWWDNVALHHFTEVCTFGKDNILVMHWAFFVTTCLKKKIPLCKMLSECMKAMQNSSTRHFTSKPGGFKNGMAVQLSASVIWPTLKVDRMKHETRMEM